MDHHSAWRIPPREAWREFIRLFRGDYLELVIAIGLSATPPAIAAASALLVRRKFDVAFSAKDPWKIATLTFAFILLQLLATGVSLAGRGITLHVTKGAIARLRSRIFETLLNLAQSTGDRTGSATLHTIATDDPERIDAMSSALITSGLPSLAGVFFLGGMAIYISPRLSISLAVLLALLVVLMRWVRRRARAAADRSRSAQRRLSGSVFSAVRLLALIRSQAAEEESIARHALRVEEVRKASIRMSWLYTVYPTMQQTLVVAMAGLVLLLGGLAIRNGAMSAGELMAFFAAVLLLRNQITPLTYFGGQITSGENALERAFGFLVKAEREPYSGTRRIDFDGRIEVDDVSFDYGDGRTVLDSVSVVIAPGPIVVLTGENGCGKTTLMHLLLGLYAPVRGRVFAGDRASGNLIPYDEIDVRHFRRRIGFVGQDSMMLDATVRENIVFGAESVTDDEIAVAAELGCATEFFRSLPKGLDTRVGEDGVLLSGGQRQRIALTRALVRKPAVLILDEPTNHLDRVSVSQFLGNLRRVEWPHATLVVSHDPAVVAEGDEVLRMREGRIEGLTRPKSLVEGGAAL